MKIKELFKHRSVTSCMNEAYCLMADHFKDMMKHTWMAVLPCAFLTALAAYLRTPNKALHDWGEANPILSFSLQSIVYVCLIVAGLIVGAAFWKWVTDKAFSHCLKRFTLVSVCSFFFVMIGGIILCAAIMALGSALGIDTLTGAHSIGISLSILLLMVFIVLLLLPLAYITPRYMLLEKGEPTKIGKSMKTGFRHGGAIFKLGFLGSLLVTIGDILLSIPMSIMSGAQVFSQLGALDGDPTGVPDYFAPLYIVVSTLAFFIYNYLNSWLFISFIYLYGCIENDEKEKMELKQQEAASVPSEVTKES